MKERKVKTALLLGLMIILFPRNTFSQGEIIYKGKDPNNYVWFNGEFWRILQKEQDGTVQMIKKESIGKYGFDKRRKSDFSRSSLRNYLNSIYYFSIVPWDRKWIQMHRFGIGRTSWVGSVGLITIQEYDRAYLDERCENLEHSNLDQTEQTKCIQSNYLNEILNTSDGSWTMSGYKNVTYMIKDNYVESFWQEKKKDVFPVIYLKRNVKWKGKGTKDQPYRILAK